MSRRCSQLTDAEATKFWPIYDAYQADSTWPSRKRERGARGPASGPASRCPIAMRKQLANELIAADETEIRARRKMQNKLMQALPPRRPCVTCSSKRRSARGPATTSPKRFRWSTDGTTSVGAGDALVAFEDPVRAVQGAASGADGQDWHSCKIPRLSDEVGPDAGTMFERFVVECPALPEDSLGRARPAHRPCRRIRNQGAT